jgi:4-hydroxybenzoate polyprenyltransferase
MRTYLRIHRPRSSILEVVKIGGYAWVLYIGPAMRNGGLAVEYYWDVPLDSLERGKRIFFITISIRA